MGSTKPESAGSAVDMQGGSGESERRAIVVALFPADAPANNSLINTQQTANKIEIVADRAIILQMDEDGELKIVRSDHSMGRSMAGWAAKMAIVTSMGLKGVFATVAMGLESSAALRDRPDRANPVEEDLINLTQQMGPGWSAVIAVYPDKWLDKAVKLFQKSKAEKVWYAPESAIAEVVAEQVDVEQLLAEQSEGPTTS